LNPSLPTRVSQWLRPDWSRTVLARRIAAGGLVVLAGVAALRPDPADGRAPVVVATRDLSPGAALTADDVRLETRLVPTIPDGSQSDVGSVVGSTLAGPARRGEVLTDVRLLGRRLAESAAGPDARIVPVHPADSALIDLVRPGDVVDVVAATEGNAQATPRVVATDAIVVSVSAKGRAQSTTGDRVCEPLSPRCARAARAASRLATTSPVKKLMPVAFPPGRLMLATRPDLTGSSPTLKTIGIVEVAALAARAPGGLPGTAITATLRRTRSAASCAIRSYCPSAQRYSIATFWPST